jgi:hypothetical protein
MSTAQAGNGAAVALDALGPIDILVVAYPADAPMTGDAMPVFLDLVDRGVIRVLDALFVVKQADGTISGFEARDLDDRHVGDLVAFDGASSGLLGDEDAATAAAAIKPGSAAVVVLYENRWAAPLMEAVHRNGGVVVENQRIPTEALLAALDATEGSV